MAKRPDQQRFRPRNGEAPRGPSAPVNRGPSRPRAVAPQLPSAEDPNGYRSPAFRDLEMNPYAIDYAGLPKDDDELDGDAQPAALSLPHGPRPGGELLTNHAIALRGASGARRAHGPRRNDRGGTDPNAYRSPGFHDARGGRVSAKTTAHEPQPRRRERPKFDAPCAQCGADATVPFQPTAERPALCKPCYLASKPAQAAAPAPSAE